MTSQITLRQRLSVQCDDVEIRINDQIIKGVNHTKSLGLSTDVQLSCGTEHVEDICKNDSSLIGALKPFISKETTIQIYNALIMLHFDYCCPVWGCLSSYLSNKLQKLPNRSARVITKPPFDTSSKHLLSTLDWERVSLRRKKQKVLMMYKTMSDLAIEYLQRFFISASLCLQRKETLHERKLTLPKPSTTD